MSIKERAPTTIVQPRELPTRREANRPTSAEDIYPQARSSYPAQPRELPTKEVAALLEQKQPQANNLNPIIAEETKSVKLDLTEPSQLREYAKIKAVEMVEVVQGIYPRYDKHIHSKCENGKKYGIQLRPDATRALIQRFAPEFLEKPRKPNRKKPNRIQARLPDMLYAQLQQHLQRSGQTMQDFLEGLVSKFFKPPDKKKER